MGSGESAPTPPAPAALSGLVLRTLPPESPQLSGSTSLTPALWLPENQKHPLASGPAGPPVGDRGGLGRWGPAETRQAGKRFRLGSGVPSSPTYLFIFRRFLGGVGRRGCEEGVGGRREREGGEAGSQATAQESWPRAGGRKALLGPASAEGRKPAEAGVAMQRKARDAGVARGAPVARGADFCLTRAPRGGGPGRCPGRSAEPASSISSKRVSSRLRCGLRAPGGRRAPHLGPRFCPMRDRVLRGFPAVAGGRSIPGRSLSGAPPACWGPELEGCGTAGGGIRAGSGSCALLFSPQETFPELAGRPHPASTLKSPHGPRVSPAWFP